jgi:(p)ppGpp synthase/HD superfamily hydrolase
MTIVERAANYAKLAHLDQVRKYTNEPYIVHPKAVAWFVSLVTDDLNVLAAAWLHDVVEDTAITIKQIDDDFNSHVAKLVSEVTNVGAGRGNRAERKRLEREHLAQACPDAKTIKLADILDNVPSIVKFDPDFAEIYVEEKQLLLPHLIEGNDTLYQRVVEMLFVPSAA